MSKRQPISTRRITSRGTVHAMAPLGVDYLCGRTAEEPFIWTDERVTCRACKRLIPGLAICQCGDYRKDHRGGKGVCGPCRRSYAPYALQCKRFRLDRKDEDDA